MEGEQGWEGEERKENENLRTRAHEPGIVVTAVKYLRQLSYKEKGFYLAHGSGGSSPKSGSLITLDQG